MLTGVVASRNIEQAPVMQPVIGELSAAMPATPHVAPVVSSSKQGQHVQQQKQNTRNGATTVVCASLFHLVSPLGRSVRHLSPAANDGHTRRRSRPGILRRRTHNLWLIPSLQSRHSTPDDELPLPTLYTFRPQDDNLPSRRRMHACALAPPQGCFFATLPVSRDSGGP